MKSLVTLVYLMFVSARLRFVLPESGIYQGTQKLHKPTGELQMSTTAQNRNSSSTLPGLSQFKVAKLGRRVLYWIWTISTKLVVIIICQEVVASGIVSLFPEMGKRLWKVPFFAFLNDFEATHRITLAHCFSIIPVISTFILWSLLLSIYLATASFDEKFKRFHLDRCKQVILIIGTVVIVSDAGMFCAAFSRSSWGGSKFSATAILATALYVASIAFVSLVSLFLSDDITVLKEKEKEN